MATPKHTAAHPITRYQTTEYNRSERVLSKLRDIYSRAQSFHLTHAQILEHLTTLYQTSDFNKLTPYYRGQFDGYHRATRDALYRYAIAWRVFFEGKLVRSEDVPAGRWNEVESDKGAHVWADAPERIF